MNRIGIIIIVRLWPWSQFNSYYVVSEYEQVIITQFGDPLGEPVDTPGPEVQDPGDPEGQPLREALPGVGRRPQPAAHQATSASSGSTPTRAGASPTRCCTSSACATSSAPRPASTTSWTARPATPSPSTTWCRWCGRPTGRPAAGLGEGEEQLDIIDAGRRDIRLEILEKAQGRTGDLGIEILDFQFKRINYVEEVQRKVYERMIAERKRIADRFRSEGQGEASRIGGERERELLRIQSGAYKTAQTIQGRADAEATRIYADAYDRSPQSRDFYAFLKTMESYPAAIDASSQLILSTDSDFYKYLKTSQ